MDRPASSGATRPMLPTAIRSSVRTITRTTNAPFEASNSIESRKNCRMSPVSGGGPNGSGKRSPSDRSAASWSFSMKASINSSVQGTSVRRGVRTIRSVAVKVFCLVYGRVLEHGVRRARNHTRDATDHGVQRFVELGRSDHVHRKFDGHQDAGHPFEIRDAAFPAEAIAIRFDVAELRRNPGSDLLLFAIDQDHGRPHPRRDRQGLPEELLRTEPGHAHERVVQHPVMDDTVEPKRAESA